MTWTVGDETVGIIGAGVMGAGIAQVAAMHGWNVRLIDVDPAIARRAMDDISERLERLVEKGRATAEDAAAARERLFVAKKNQDLAACSLIIEAIVEELEIKTRVLKETVAHLPGDAIIASNTSSLSITKLGAAIGEPHRTVGMHFFNPAPIMQLVEVIAGDRTEGAVVDRVAEIATNWGKKVARAADVPGFIVNHVARPYYLEAFRILEDGYADPQQIDETMKSLGGFRMGPLELTDLIGQDVNAATTRSVWEQLNWPPLLTPSRFQEQLVKAGRLGRKTGRGVYLYEGDRQRAAIDVRTKPLADLTGLPESANSFAERAVGRSAGDLQNYVLARILVAIIVQAHLAYERGVASREDIDVAMRFGVNYPAGPFEWTEKIGAEACLALLKGLQGEVDATRFAPPKSLGTGG